jgi:hypothetical protein
MIEFKCECGKFLKLPHSYAGKQTQCPACLKTLRVPGAPPEGPAPTRPKRSRPGRSLCVDCGQAFATGQMLEHTGQLVCTVCYHKRKPVELKYPKKRSRKFKLLLWLGIVVVLAAGAAVVCVLVF